MAACIEMHAMEAMGSAQAEGSQADLVHLHMRRSARLDAARALLAQRSLAARASLARRLRAAALRAPLGPRSGHACASLRRRSYSTAGRVGPELLCVVDCTVSSSTEVWRVPARSP